jgi:hypothetical protein
MKLSEAIRLGAMMKPQGVGWLLRDGKTCAIGAALDAVGAFGARTQSSIGYDLAEKRWGDILRLKAGHPSCEPTIEEVWAVVQNLNDYCGWTREQIADWIETIERRAEADQAGTQQETPTTAVSFAK